jgi:hypothetical protein
LRAAAEGLLLTALLLAAQGEAGAAAEEAPLPFSSWKRSWRRSVRSLKKLKRRAHTADRACKATCSDGHFT